MLSMAAKKRFCGLTELSPRARSSENFATEESKASPSWKVTPWRSLNVYVLPSSEISQRSASCGLTLPSPSMVTRPSKTFCQVTWPMATGAAMVGSRPAGSTAMPSVSAVFGAASAIVTESGSQSAVPNARLSAVRRESVAACER